jgi:Flp pilus assembly CpaF family ATPase
MDDITPEAPDSDPGDPRQFFEAHGGTRLFSLAALVERVIAQFVREHADNSPALLAARTRGDRLKLVRDTLQYVLAVESLALTTVEQAEVMRQVYSEVFAYGPLDSLLADESVTTIALEGVDKAAVRRGHGDMEAIGQVFEDYEQMTRMVARMLRNAGAFMRQDVPYIESGLVIEGRRVCLSLVTPPASPVVSAVIRLHPRQLPPLESLVASDSARELIGAIARSAHGLVIVGEAESGKTTLMAHVARIAALEGAVSVERAGELDLPEGVERLTVQWAEDGDDETGRTFGEQITAALERAPRALLLDEVRADEPKSIVPLLTADPAPRLLWTFRGTTNSKRLAAALGTLARMGDPARSEVLAKALYTRLPFVLTMRRRPHGLELQSIGEWQWRSGAEYPDYVELMTAGWEGLELTGRRAQQTLDLPDGFWG